MSKFDIRRKELGLTEKEMVNPIISHHAYKRVEERFGIKNQKEIHKLVKRALNLGIVYEIQGNKGRYHKYGDMTFIFVGRKLLTAFKYVKKTKNNVENSIDSNVYKIGESEDKR
jgi:hypothetical protein